MITTVAAIVATLAAIGAGLATSSKITSTSGPGIAWLTGISTGTATWFVVFLTVATGLHRLIR
jgi:hypothetical protein